MRPTHPAGESASHSLSRFRGTWIGLAAVFLLGALLYAGTLSHELHYDDGELIRTHPAIHDPWNLVSIFGESYWGRDDGLYRPLTIWTLSVNHRCNEVLGLGEERTAGYHLFNLLLHAAVASLFYVFLLRLAIPARGCLAAALLFAVLPIHTEAVTAIVGRSELLATACGLIFLLLHRRRPASLAAPPFYLLALCAKESAVSYLLLAVWMDLLPGDRPRRGIFKFYAACLALLGGWLSLRAAVIGGASERTPFIDNPLVDASTPERVLTAARVQLDYLRLQLFPWGLSSDYSFDQIPVISSLVDLRVLGFVAVVLAAGVLAWLTRERHPQIGFAVLSYATLFSVTGNFLFPIGTIMGERLAYAPSLMVCLLLGWAAWALRERIGRVAVVGLVAVLVLFGTLVVLRNRTWATPRSFVEAQLLAAPRSAKAHHNVARVSQTEGDLDRAISEYRRAVAIYPRYFVAWDQLGTALAQAGKPERAAEAYLRAAEIAPRFPLPWLHLGILHRRQGDLGAAIDAYREAIARREDDPLAHYNLGDAYHAEGRLERAADAYRRALELNPGYLEAHLNLGAVYATQGRLAEARREWRAVLAIDPDHPGARENLRRLVVRHHP